MTARKASCACGQLHRPAMATPSGSRSATAMPASGAPAVPSAIRRASRAARSATSAATKRSSFGPATAASRSRRIFARIAVRRFIGNSASLPTSSPSRREPLPTRTSQRRAIPFTSCGGILDAICQRSGVGASRLKRKTELETLESNLRVWDFFGRKSLINPCMHRNRTKPDKNVEPFCRRRISPLLPRSFQLSSPSWSKSLPPGSVRERP